MPKPVETVLELVRLGGTAEFWASVGDTFLAWMLAFLISTVVGIPVGLILGRSPRAAVSTHFLIDFLRTIPAIALIPLALLVLGPSFAMVVVVAAMAGIWPVLIQSIYAGRQLDPLLFQVSRSFRLTRLDRLRFVLAPDIMAFVWPGIRLAVTAALLVTVAAQLIGGAPGVGTSIQNALLSERPVTMFAYVIASALLGLLINAALVWLQEKLLWWHPSVRGKNR
ncbi:ABC transporter permease subunit [Pseudarthrobacter sp. J75]|uniref:ABC transporter permease n=1 Tax=unclassified Pseudarthrobacter TaxID=2647000 RepID=UPI002E7FEE81|nr:MULTISPECIES: ABC transporter permease subunit [unclassified Pseudarthrobacter]MEE2522442.1 ABC transporter permease subunit [Pseudarthrobacter sp. J47]MEE2529227.1 ABC transporter permease subunit [Pseudarthrobacter sp. J75]